MTDLWQHAPVTPRAWQAEALPLVIAAARARKRAIVCATMGAGKSYILSAIARLALPSAPGKIVISTPTKALVRQLAATVREWCGGSAVGVYYSDRKQPERPIIIACNASMDALAQRLTTAGERVSMLIADEVHRTEGASIKAAIEAMQPTVMIGFSATPFRSAKHESLELWDTISYTYTLGDAVNDGVLVIWRVVSWHDKGETDTDRACLVMMERDAVGPGIVSATSIADAEKYAAYLTERGFEARPVHSERPQAENDLRLQELRGGAIRAVVHVSMLSEGIDLPWLRWICMRRPVQARVRFIQSFGRVLRADPNNPSKIDGVILDPHHLFGLHGIPTEPVIGPTGLVEDPMEPEARLGGGIPEETVLPPPMAIDEATQWARHLLMLMQAHGLAKGTVTGSKWRTRRPSAPQIAALGSLIRAIDYLPEPSKSTIRHLCSPAVARGLQRGAVSDVISVLIAVGDAARASYGCWHWPDEIETPPLAENAVEGLKAIKKGAT